MTKTSKEFSNKTIASAFKSIDGAINRAHVQLEWAMNQAKEHGNKDPILFAYLATSTERVKTALRKYVEGHAPLEFAVVKGQPTVEWATDDNDVVLDKTDMANWYSVLPADNFMNWGAVKDEALIELTMLDELEKLVKKSEKTNKSGTAKFDVKDPEVTRRIRNLMDAVRQEQVEGSRIDA